MKNFFLVAIVSLVSVLCASAAVTNSDSNVSENQDYSVTATIAGIDESFDFDAKTLELVYKLMPQNVKDLCAENYKAVASKIEKSGSKGFTYSSVRITPIKKANGVDLKFSYKGNTLVVKNYTKSEFDYLFSL